MQPDLILPRVTWITPTFCRPQTLPNLIACFLAQQYPAERLRLLILDDAAQYSRSCRGDRWRVVSIDQRFNSLPAKFNALVGLTETEDDNDVIVVAEDDDSFLPHHTLAHVTALHEGDFSKPSQVYSDYGCSLGQVRTEHSAGRFHGSIAFRRKHWATVGGWPLSDAANFDQQMMTHFAATGRTVDPCKYAGPSYVFRWHTNQYHGQSLASGPGDTAWYRDHDRQQLGREWVETLFPQLDTYTQVLYARQHDLQPLESDARLAAPRGT